MNEKTFEADFQGVYTLNNKKRIIVSNYVDKHCHHKNKETKISMPVDMIDYVIKHPCMSFELDDGYDSFDSIDSGDTNFEKIDIIHTLSNFKKYYYTSNNEYFKTFDNDFININVNTSTSTITQHDIPCEEIFDSNYLSKNDEYYSINEDYEKIINNKENIPVTRSEMERYASFYEEESEEDSQPSRPPIFQK